MRQVESWHFSFCFCFELFQQIGEEQLKSLLEQVSKLRVGTFYLFLFLNSFQQIGEEQLKSLLEQVSMQTAKKTTVKVRGMFVFLTP